MSCEIQCDSNDYDKLMTNCKDEAAWRRIFGNHLNSRVCTIEIRERWDYKLYGSRSKNYREIEDYTREVVAYC
jgi:hypothetical protein